MGSLVDPGPAWDNPLGRDGFRVLLDWGECQAGRTESEQHTNNPPHSTTLLGSAPKAGGDPMLFVNPACIFLVIAPWALLPLKWAVAFWTGSLLFGISHLISALVFRWGGRRLGPTRLWATVLTLGSLPFLAIAVKKRTIKPAQPGRSVPDHSPDLRSNIGTLQNKVQPSRLA